MITGRVGDDMTLEEGKAAAKQVGLAVLATVRDTLGSLDKVVRIVKTLGMVNSTPEFKDHPLVINGFSELMKEVFGEDAGVGTGSREWGWDRCRGILPSKSSANSSCRMPVLSRAGRKAHLVNP